MQWPNSGEFLVGAMMTKPMILTLMVNQQMLLWLIRVPVRKSNALSVARGGILQETGPRIGREGISSVPSAERVDVLQQAVGIILRTRMYPSGSKTRGAVVKRLGRALNF